MPPTLEQALAHFQPGLPLAVAFSGGADSTALLLACARRWPQQVRAVHVHHGLQRAADDFERHCRQVCTQAQVPLQVKHMDARHAQGQSPEDAARRARYAALVSAVHEGWPDVHDLALAHHADDQVETMLIALSRGAGLPGLSAMPAQWQAQGLCWHRPLLQVPGPDLRAWLAAQGQAWVEDPSNSDENLTRNRIRARVLPALEAALPGFRQTFARSAAHAAQAQQQLQDIAAGDLQQVGVPPGIAALQALDRARQAQVIRLWLRQTHGTTPSTAQMAELLDQLQACRTRGHRLHLRVGRGQVQREGDVMVWSDLAAGPQARG